MTREEIARIIDPEAHDEIHADDNEEVAAIFAEAWGEALAKADAILAPTDQRVRELEADKARLDWLQMQYVEVRAPLPHGSRARFRAITDDSYEGEERPSDLRAKIDAAKSVAP